MIGVMRHARSVKAICAVITRFSGVTATPANATHTRKPKTAAARDQRRAAG